MLCKIVAGIRVLEINVTSLDFFWAAVAVVLLSYLPDIVCLFIQINHYDFEIGYFFSGKAIAKVC